MSSGANKTVLRASLLRYFRKHNPARAESIDEVMTAYDGEYDQLFRDLEERYHEPVALVADDDGFDDDGGGGIGSNIAAAGDDAYHQQPTLAQVGSGGGGGGSWSGGSGAAAAGSGVFSAGSDVSPRARPVYDDDAHAAALGLNDMSASSPPRTADVSIIRRQDGEETLEIPSRSAVSIVVSGGASMKSGTMIPIDHVDAVLEQQRLRALHRAREEALELMKKANRNVTAARAADPHRAVMNDPSDISSYKNQKGLSEDRAAAVSRLTHSFVQPPSLQRQQQRDASSSFSSPASPSPNKQQQPSGSDSTPSQMRMTPENSSLMAAYQCMMSAPRPKSYQNPSSSSSFPGSLGRAAYVSGERQQNRPSVTATHGSVSDRAWSRGSTASNNTSNFPTAAEAGGSTSSGNFMTHGSPMSRPPPPTGDERLVVHHGDPINTKTTTTTTIYEPTTPDAKTPQERLANNEIGSPCSDASATMGPEGSGTFRNTKPE